MGVGGLLGGLGLGAGIYQGYEQGKAQRRAKKSAKNIKNLQLQNLELGFADQESAMKRANRLEESGMTADENRFEQRAQQGVSDAATAAQGQVTAGLARSGLSGSGLATQLQSGVARQTMRANTDAQLAVQAMRGANRLRRAGNIRALGQFQAYKANARNAILGEYGDKIVTLLSNQSSGAPLNLAGLGAFAGQLGGGGGGFDPSQLEQ